MSTRQRKAAINVSVVRIRLFAAPRIATATKNENKGCHPAALFVWNLAAAAVAVATEEKNKCEDNDPGAAIIEKTAKAVVIHKFSPFGRLCCPLDSRI